MICKNCKKELYEDILFCPYCGIRIDTNMIDDCHQKNKKGYIGIIILLSLISVAVILIVFICNIVFFKNVEKISRSVENEVMEIMKSAEEFYTEFEYELDEYHNFIEDYKNFKNNFNMGK